MDLKDMRDELDKIDDQLMKFIIERFKLVKQIGEYKKNNNIMMMQNHRIEHVLSKARTYAIKNNIDANVLVKVYTKIIDVACELENDIIDEKSN